MAEPVLIWSEEHGAWWAPERRGYTRSIREAGRYPRAVALTIVEEANLYVGEGFHEIAVVDPMGEGEAP